MSVRMCASLLYNPEGRNVFLYFYFLKLELLMLCENSNFKSPFPKMFQYIIFIFTVNVLPREFVQEQISNFPALEVCQ